MDLAGVERELDFAIINRLYNMTSGRLTPLQEVVKSFSVMFGLLDLTIEWRNSRKALASAILYSGGALVAVEDDAVFWLLCGCSYLRAQDNNPYRMA
jgi:hypothetical protein